MSTQIPIRAKILNLSRVCYLNPHSLFRGLKPTPQASLRLYLPKPLL